mmetsp:Transcript_20149/g.46225  ORF Transcript_20149/g.46225 Transcript_20149/m.46225 type:complete len:323 (+) Transcript_20149:667-1635(+)
MGSEGSSFASSSSGFTPVVEMVFIRFIVDARSRASCSFCARSDSAFFSAASVAAFACFSLTSCSKRAASASLRPRIFNVVSSAFSPRTQYVSRYRFSSIARWSAVTVSRGQLGKRERSFASDAGRGKARSAVKVSLPSTDGCDCSCAAAPSKQVAAMASVSFIMIATWLIALIEPIPIGTSLASASRNDWNMGALKTPGPSCVRYCLIVVPISCRSPRWNTIVSPNSSSSACCRWRYIRFDCHAASAAVVRRVRPMKGPFARCASEGGIGASCGGTLTYSCPRCCFGWSPLTATRLPSFAAYTSARGASELALAWTWSRGIA